MAGQKNIESLQTKHAELEQAIEVENNRPLPDELHIQELKRQKLRIKDEIARMGAG
ncbi:MAG: YdcH family protein [Alphaproteobacteria bacterium]